MKTIVCFFALLAVGLALPIESENEEVLLIPFSTEEIKSLTPEQLQCIKDSLEQIVNDNPQLQWWFDAVKKSSDEIVAKAKKCEELENPEYERKCYGFIRIVAKIESLRLILILPKDQRKIIGVINGAVRECLNAI